jgi:hypothetical protein
VFKDGLTISERIFTCSACGISFDRDENAAINLRRLGLSATELPEGLREVTPVERKALASAVLDEVNPASAKQEATAPDSRRATRRRTSKGVLVRVEAGSLIAPRPRPHSATRSLLSALAPEPAATKPPRRWTSDRAGRFGS